jgi:catechol 2,3-dioxygenase-like lactoylglutathione lyase family enzyme
MPRLDHINIHVRDGKAMVAFLEAVLDVREGFRPPFRHPGHWLYADGLPSIHIDLVERDADFPQGIVNHLAFGLYDYEAVLARVEASGFPFEHAGIPGTPIGQIFVIGPEGIRLEIQYRRAE